MEELIAQQAELIARLQDELEEWKESHRTMLSSVQLEVEERDETIQELKDELEDVDITPQYRALYDLAAALLKKMTGAEKPTQAECHGIDEAYQLSKQLDEYDL